MHRPLLRHGRCIGFVKLMQPSLPKLKMPMGDLTQTTDSSALDDPGVSLSTLRKNDFHIPVFSLGEKASISLAVSQKKRPIDQKIIVGFRTAQIAHRARTKFSGLIIRPPGLPHPKQTK